MAPFSDVDLMFLTTAKPTAQQERLVEAILQYPVGPEAQGRPFGPLDRRADGARESRT